MVGGGPLTANQEASLIFFYFFFTVFAVISLSPASELAPDGAASFAGAGGVRDGVVVLFLGFLSFISLNFFFCIFRTQQWRLVNHHGAESARRGAEIESTAGRSFFKIYFYEKKIF